MKVSYLYSLALILLFSFRIQAVHSLGQASHQNNQIIQTTNDVKGIALLFAFMNSTILATPDNKLHFWDQNRKTKYSYTIQEAHQILQYAFSTMVYARSSFIALPAEQKLMLHPAVPYPDKARYIILLDKLSRLDQTEKDQLELVRYYEFMTNSDLKDTNLSKNEVEQIESNRLKYKQSLMPNNTGADQWRKVNQAMSQKLGTTKLAGHFGTQKMTDFTEYLSNCIKEKLNQ